MMLAAISAPGPKLRGASCTMTAPAGLPHRGGQGSSRSSGEIVSRSNDLDPGPALGVELLGRPRGPPGPWPRRQSGSGRVPGRSTRARPISMVSISSGTSSLAAWYSAFASKKITGSGSRIAAASRARGVARAGGESPS